MATDQPFDEIADSLADLGWSRDGDAMEDTEGRNSLDFAADAGNGRILVADTRETLDAALNGEGDEYPHADLLKDLPGSVRTVVAVEEGSGCATVAGAGENAETRQGELVFEPVGDADLLLERVKKATDAEFEKPTEEGERVAAGFTDESPDGKGIAAPHVAFYAAIPPTPAKSVVIPSHGEFKPDPLEPDCG